MLVKCKHLDFLDWGITTTELHSPWCYYSGRCCQLGTGALPDKGLSTMTVAFLLDILVPNLGSSGSGGGSLGFWVVLCSWSCKKPLHWPRMPFPLCHMILYTITLDHLTLAHGINHCLHRNAISRWTRAFLTFSFYTIVCLLHAMNPINKKYDFL